MQEYDYSYTYPYIGDRVCACMGLGCSWWRTGGYHKQFPNSGCYPKEIIALHVERTRLAQVLKLKDEK